MQELIGIIRKWYSELDPPPGDMFVGIRISDKGSSVYIYDAENLSYIIEEARKSNRYNKNTGTRVFDTVSYEIRRRGIVWDSATIFDFLDAFPTQEKFLNKRCIGIKSLAFMKDELAKRKLPWPVR